MLRHGRGRSSASCGPETGGGPRRPRSTAGPSPGPATGRAGCGQGGLRRGLAVDPDLPRLAGFGPGLDLVRGRTGRATAARDLPAQRLGPAGQIFGGGPAQAAAGRQERDRLKHVGLARAVRARQAPPGGRQSASRVARWLRKCDRVRVSITRPPNGLPFQNRSVRAVRVRPASA